MIFSGSGSWRMPHCSAQNRDALVESMRNPFSTRFVEPGAIPYFFEPSFIKKIKEEDPFSYTKAFNEALGTKTELTTWIGCSFLMEKFKTAQCRGQIAGVHGCGKSTLLSSLVRVFLENGATIAFFELHNGARVLPNGADAEIETIGKAGGDKALKSECGLLPLVVVDGYEQLGFASRTRLDRLCRKFGCGLLITTHTRKWGIPVLIKPHPSRETLGKIVDYLLDESLTLPSDTFIRKLYAKKRENFRDILFGLYDWFEMRKGE